MPKMRSITCSVFGWVHKASLCLWACSQSLVETCCCKNRRCHYACSYPTGCGNHNVWHMLLHIKPWTHGQGVDCIRYYMTFIVLNAKALEVFQEGVMSRTIMWVVGHRNVFYVGEYPNATFRSCHSFIIAMLCSKKGKACGRRVN